MDITNRDIVARQTIDPPHRHLIVECEFEKTCEQLERAGLLTVSDNLYRGLLSVVFSGSFRGTRFIQPADMFPAHAEKKDRSLEDYLSPVDSTEEVNKQQDEKNATEFVFSGYVDSPDLTKQTNRNYVKECDVCVQNIVTVLED